MRFEFCTLFDKNYLSRGLALYQSLIEVSCPFRLWILCLDDESFNLLTKMNLPFVRLIKLQEIETENLKAIKNGRSIVEYYWTLTPFLPLFIITKYRLPKIAYLDADLFFYSNPQPIYQEMANNSVLIIPHRFYKSKGISERTAGEFNVGMLIFRNDAIGRKCLKWWGDRCLEWCFLKFEDNKLGDQKYLEQFPRLFKKVHVLANEGAGVAPWNVGRYKIKKIRDQLFVNNTTLIFYHYQAFKFYFPKKFFPAIPSSHYIIPSPYRQLLYKPYLQAIAEKYQRIWQFSPSWRFGFAPRPPLSKQLGQAIFVGYLEASALLGMAKQVFVGNKFELVAPTGE